MAKSFFYSILFFIAVVALMVLDISKTPQGRKTDAVKFRDYDSILASDTLHVMLGYNSVNYFVFKGTPMGYQFELVVQLCKDLGISLDIDITNDLEKAFQELAFGRCDLLAMDLAVADGRFPDIAFAESLSSTRSFLVQRRNKNGQAPVSKLEQLDGKTVVIPRQTIYNEQLRHIGDSLGITIHIVECDSVGSEELSNQVADGKLDFTVCDQYLARTLNAFYPELDFNLPLSKPIPVAWAVNSRSKKWLDVLNLWLKKFSSTGHLKFLQGKYFDHPLFYLYNSSPDHNFSGSSLSKYDGYIKKYSREIGWDWRLIASIIYQESRFEPNLQSASGAFGIMQMMPTTASRYGVFHGSSVEEQIKGGTQAIFEMDTTFAHYISDKKERQQVVVAAYNLGVPHFLDALELAQKLKKEPITYAVVLECLQLKTQPKYYNDPVVKYGYINPWYVKRFVKEIYQRYNAYCAVFEE